MPRDYLHINRTAIRRSDRAVEDDAWIRAFLHTAATGTLATVHDGQPFINQNLFVYDEAAHSLIVHTASTGRTGANVAAHPQVCFSIMQMGRLLPADEALEFSVEYAGVVIFGTAAHITDEAEAIAALQLLMDKYAPHLAAGQDYRPPVPEEIKRTAVFRIQIDDWTAKKKEVDAFPGAYWYDEAAMLASVRARPMWQGRLEALFIAPAKDAPMQPVAQVEAVARQGLVGDRKFSPVPTPEAPDPADTTDVTLIALEDIEAVQRGGIPLSPAQTRRNLLTVGVPLNALVGRRFWIGDVLLEGRALCEPCSGLAHSSGHGHALIAALLHRGGLRCRILTSGTLVAGDVIRPAG